VKKVSPHRAVFSANRALASELADFMSHVVGGKYEVASGQNGIETEAGIQLPHADAAIAAPQSSGNAR
jgi:hypothetical protein